MWRQQQNYCKNIFFLLHSVQHGHFVGGHCQQFLALTITAKNKTWQLMIHHKYTISYYSRQFLEICSNEDCCFFPCSFRFMTCFVESVCHFDVLIYAPLNLHPVSTYYMFSTLLYFPFINWLQCHALKTSFLYWAVKWKHLDSLLLHFTIFWYFSKFSTNFFIDFSYRI